MHIVIHDDDIIVQGDENKVRRDTSSESHRKTYSVKGRRAREKARRETNRRARRRKARRKARRKERKQTWKKKRGAREAI